MGERGKTVVVVGGGAAGMSAASRVKRLKPEYRVVVFEQTRYVSFALCGIPFRIKGVVKGLDELVHYPLEVFVKERGIDIRLETRVEEIDPDARTLVAVSRRTKERVRMEWDSLILATGAVPKAAEFLDELPEGVFYVSHLEDAERIREYALKVDKVVVAGAGYLGLEMADAIASLGKRVVVVEMADRVLPRSLDRDVARTLQDRMRERGVALMLNTSVTGVLSSGGRLRGVELSNGKLEADMLILAMGVKPNVELAKSMGLKLGETGAVWADGFMRTSAEGVYSAGDNTETVHAVTGKRTWFPFAVTANKMGFVAGTNAAGGSAFFPGVVGTTAMEVFGTVVASTGLTTEAARSEGFDVVSVTVTAPGLPRYMPDGRQVTLKVVADRLTGRLLGAQALGDITAFWRVNTIAALVRKGGSVWDLFYLDLGYAPPLDAVWDPIVIAGRLLMRELGEAPRL